MSVYLGVYWSLCLSVYLCSLFTVCQCIAVFTGHCGSVHYSVMFDIRVIYVCDLSPCVGILLFSLVTICQCITVSLLMFVT